MAIAVTHPRITERQLQDALVECLRWSGWRVVHHWLSIRTAPGWPDLVAVKGTRLLAIEVKSATGVVSGAQRAWLEALAVAGVEVAVIRPEHWLGGAFDAWLVDPGAKPALP